MARKNPRVPVDIVAQTTKFDSAIKTSAKAATASFAAFAAASTAAVVGITKATINLSGELNQIAKDAKRVGTSVEDWQKVTGAIGLLTGGAVDGATAMQTLQRNMADAREGTGEAAGSLEKLGLTLDELSPDDLAGNLVTIAGRFDGLADHAEKSQVAMELFGRAGKELVPALAAGGDAVQEAIGRVEDAGLVSSEAAFQAELLQDSLADASRAMLVMRTEALAPLMPVITGVVGGLVDLSQELRDTGALEDFGDAVARTFIEVMIPAVTVGVAQSKKALAGLTSTLAAGIVGYNKMAVAAKTAGVALEFVKNRGKVSGESLAELEALTLDLAESQIFLDAATREFVGVEEDVAVVMDGVLERIRAMQAEFEELTTSQRHSSSETETLLAEGTDAYENALLKRRRALEANVDATAILEEKMAENTEAVEQRRATAMEAADTKRQQSLDIALMAVQTVATISLNILDAAADAEVAIINRTTEDRKEAALKAFEVNKNTQLAQAHILREIGALMAFATAPNYIAGVAMAIAAQAQGWVNFGIIAAQQPPSFHMGGMVGGGPARSISPAGSPDEVNATLLRGERVQSRAEVRAGRGPQTITTVFQVGPRTVDAMTTEALRTGQGSTFDAFRAVQPRRVGRHNPRRRR